MKIVVLTASPRKNGNSFALTDFFINAAKERGHDVVRFDTAFMQVNGCRACQTCFETGKACSFDDDFNKLASHIESADAVVFTMPVYWYSIPACLKAVIDKLYSFMIGKKDISGKQCALISCCAEDDMTVFDGVLASYTKTAELLRWESVGTVLAAGVNNEGEVINTSAPARAAALADKLGKPASGLVTKDMTMGEILLADRRIADILVRSGMHCVGCPSSVNETLEEACGVHGIECERILDEINSFLSK